jgi:GH15 family glucan-1,4-alpha-glucosidase
LWVRGPWKRERSWARARDDARRRGLGAFLPNGALPREHGGTAVDAAASLLVVHRLISPRDLRAARLVDTTIAALGCGPLLYRYEPDGSDGFDPGEAPFVPASWWAVSALAVLGRSEAAERAEQLGAILPRLQSEEFDPTRNEALGKRRSSGRTLRAARALFDVDRAQSLRRRVARRLSAGS